MRLVVVGAGALGSIYAAFLARAGHDVVLLARGERGAALQRHGIPVTGLESFTAECTVVTDSKALAGLRGVDAVIVAVKTYDTEAALSPLDGLGPSCAFSIQNGVQKNVQLARTFGSQTTLGAVGMLGGEVLAAERGLPGPVDYKMAGATVIGELDGTASPRVDALVSALRDAGLSAAGSTEITSVEWSKFVGWSAVSALAVLTRLPTWRFLVEADTALLAARIARETAAVAAAEGVELQDGGMSSRAIVAGSEADAARALQQNGERMRETAPDFRQSILQDADRGKPLEVNETLGYTLERGRELGVATPTLDYCVRILRVVSAAAAKKL